ncbi:MAG: DEAD/DEAH box helicase [Candidatus Hodarchaeales archaeon]|jgi:superfamily II DNA or RNA helicase
MKSSPAEIYFAGDDLCLTGVEERYLADIPYEKDQQRILTYPSYLKTILKVLNQFEIPIESKLSIDHPLTISFDPKYELRPFQQEAFDEWKKKGRGTLILPTGSGKTFLGLAAIHYLSQATLVLAPTIDLVEQWVSNLQLLGISKKEIGQYGGGRQESDRPIIVSTYESARIYLHRFRNQIGLLIFDEVHHLSGERWLAIAQGMVAPYRMGLTATLGDDHPTYNEIEQFVGPILFQMTPTELRELGYVAPFLIKRLPVPLTDMEKQRYLQYRSKYLEYLRKTGLNRARNPYQELVYRAYEPEARVALAAHRQARDIQFNTKEKIKHVREILLQHAEEKALVFSESVSFAERVSRELLVPVITGQTATEERRAILAGFRKGDLRIIATSRVLDEGVDVPDASIGIVVSGSAQVRQFIQRLGRILRPVPGKEAVLYEVITIGTGEESISRRRKNGIEEGRNNY